jgi:hypothetical protein
MRWGSFFAGGKARDGFGSPRKVDLSNNFIAVISHFTASET